MGKEEREPQDLALNASEGRALWKNLSHQAQGFNLWEAGGCSPSSLDTLLSNSLKQYVHTDTASWRRKNTKDAHTPHAHHTHPCAPLVDTPAPALVRGLFSGPDGLPEKRGPKEMEHMHPSLLSPRQSLGKAKARARRPLIAPRIKAPTFQASLIYRKRDRNWFLPREAIKQWENNKYLLSIYLFFF